MPYMTNEQRELLITLRTAHELYQQADEHRNQLLAICQTHKVPAPAIRETLGLEAR